MIIDHVAVAVASLEDAIPGWKVAFGYERMTEVVVEFAPEGSSRFLAPRPNPCQ